MQVPEALAPFGLPAIILGAIYMLARLWMKKGYTASLNLKIGPKD